MAVKLTETNTDHHGEPLPKGLYGSATEAGEIVSYKARWREQDEDGVRGQRSKSFNAAKLGSLDRALEVALAYAEEVTAIVKADGAVAKVDASDAITVGEVFPEWLVLRASTLSREYGEKAVRLWDGEIATRPIASVRLKRLSQDQSIIVRFQDALVKEGLRASKRREILKLLRAVLRWGRRRHPNALTIELSGLFELPPEKKNRLAYAADAYGLERIIEAVLRRPAHDDLLPLRDAALVAAMGFTVATRPSEWRQSATWENLYASGTVELQRSADHEPEDIPGLKTGAHVALLLPNAWDRIAAYRAVLEDRFGPQPENGLVFQVLDADGPVWISPDDGSEPVPLAWSKNAYNQWVARVWGPARAVAAQAPDAPPGLEKMTFYDCRHTAISMALHSTLVMGPHGTNLHPLAGWAGHDIQTLQRYYAHFIARYQGSEPIELEEECARARARVEAEPFKPAERPPSSQRDAQRRRRARRRAAGEPARR